MTEARLITWLDVPTWRAHLATTGEVLHVYLGSVDVTRDSSRAVFCEDGIHGYVWRYLRNAHGQHYRAPGADHAAYQVLFGVLTIAPGDPF
jgi:hypothetical protein